MQAAVEPHRHQGVTRGRPSDRTVVIQNSWAFSSASRVVSHGAACAVARAELRSSK